MHDALTPKAYVAPTLEVLNLRETRDIDIEIGIGIDIGLGS